MDGAGGVSGSHDELMEEGLWEEERLTPVLDVVDALAVQFQVASRVVNVFHEVFLLAHVHSQTSLHLEYKNRKNI